MMFFYKAKVTRDRFNFVYDFDTSLLKNQVYNNDLTLVYFATDTVIDGESLIAITEDEYSQAKKTITPMHQEPPGQKQLTELDILGQQLVEKDLQVLELQQENQVLGQQIVDIDLRLLMGGM